MNQGTLNNLSRETSPYLLEHANNPVNWFAWNEEAFKLAKENNKLIFVSVGYSACHWCHVMRRESFSNQEVASILNEHFISIKVDREERPDLDHLLQMTFQVMNGRGGGWPLSVFMTPDKRPFYSGTYFPLNSKYGMPGFIEVLNAVIKAYNSKLTEIQSQSQKIENVLLDINSPKDIDSDFALSSMDIVGSLSQFYDPDHGGFGSAPKFPSETALSLLLHESAFINNLAGKKMVFKTLDSMINGGIYDQLGGGFHRYSVDDHWLVPHFEKMLYNQSLLVVVLLEAYRLSQNPLYLEKVKQTLHYVIREMKTPEGGFFSSQNADSEDVEGKFFVWDKKELNFLDETHLDVISAYYGISDRGNWESKNILHVAKDIKDLSVKFSMDEEKIKSIISRSKEMMFEKRQERIKPSTDTKIITSWNALMTKAFIHAYRVFSDPKEKDLFLDISTQSINFLVSMITENGIYRIFMDNKRSIKGFLDDFQYSISALLDFYEITLNEGILSKAISLFDYALDHFYDTNHGAFYYSLNDHNTIITRYKEFFDSPLPSANSYAIENSLRLSFFNDHKADFYRNIAQKSLQQIKLTSDESFMSLASMLYVKQLFTNHFTELIIIYNSQDFQLHNYINQLWIPYRLQVDYSIEGTDNHLKEKSFLKGKTALNNKTTVFICKNFACSKPLTNRDEIDQYLNNVYLQHESESKS